MRTLYLLFYFVACSALYGQSTNKDNIIYPLLSINGFKLGDGTSSMKEYFGKPIGQSEVFPQPDCEEWCERHHIIYAYGETQYINKGNSVIALADCDFKELIEEGKSDIITAFEISSTYNNYILSYKDYQFKIGDNVTEQEKYRVLFPNAIERYENLKVQGRIMPLIKIDLVDVDGKSVYSKYGVNEIKFYLSKEGKVEKISIDYPLE